MNPHDARPYAAGFAKAGTAHRLLGRLLAVIEYIAACVLAADVLVVFASVIWRYFLHDPLNWAEEIARALMVTQVFLGAATAVGRAQHVGIDSFRALFPVNWRPAMIQLCDWIIVAVSVALLFSSAAMLIDSRDQTTPIGLPQWIYIWPDRKSVV